MWRRCDLHNHTFPNEQFSGARWDADSFVAACVANDLEVVAITDHDRIDRVEDVVRAAINTNLEVVPGVELSTDRGHLLALAPGEGGLQVMRQFVERVGATEGEQVKLDTVTGALGGKRTNGERFIDGLVLIGAHVDAPGSLLATPNPLSANTQIEHAKALHAIEVASEERLEEWQQNGVKQSDHLFALIRGSDTHDPAQRQDISTWIYLPDITPSDFKHAFAVPEASISVAVDRPTRPDHIIESIAFEGGHHDGLVLTFPERTTAIIGPPNSGKSLIIDALKFAFGVECDIEEVEKVTRARMAARMPPGSTVRVVIRTPSGRKTLERTVGGQSQPSPSFVPIVFSQTELTRRGIADRPAIELLDLHCEDIEDRIAALHDSTEAVSRVFERALSFAEEGRDLRKLVLNPEDGLAATEDALAELAGTEAAAHLATDAEKVAIWRREVSESIDSWEADHQITEPTFPKSSSIRTANPDLEKSMPAEDIEAAAKKSTEAARRAVADSAGAIRKVLSKTDAAFSKVESEISKELAAAGFETGSELAEELGVLKRRAADLGAKEKKLKQVEERITSELKTLRSAIEIARQAREELTRVRKETCSVVNSSMRSFFAMIDPAGETRKLDELFEDIKIGTGLRPRTRRKTIERLDRFRLLEVAVRLVQGDAVEPDADFTTQDRVVEEAVGREKTDELLALSCLWPGDALELGWKDTSPTTPFSGLTEGLRALAVKEISFAASHLPVITDQPEDAVPTRSVFESLVPTIREQRVDRQFIVVSHDANIVVSGDVDRVVVLEANDDGSPHVGSLFDDRVRDAALEHLEGGRPAFALRAARYAALGTL